MASLLVLCPLCPHWFMVLFICFLCTETALVLSNLYKVFLHFLFILLNFVHFLLVSRHTSGPDMSNSGRKWQGFFNEGMDIYHFLGPFLPEKKKTRVLLLCYWFLVLFSCAFWAPKLIWFRLTSTNSFCWTLSLSSWCHIILPVQTLTRTSNSGREWQGICKEGMDI